MFTIRPSRQQMYADDPKFLWKLILRSLTIVLSIVSIGLIGWSLANQVTFPDNIHDSYDDTYYDWPYSNDVWFLPWEFITLGLSVMWNAANILVLLTRNRPIHPGANVACDLLLWLGLIVTGAFAALDAGIYFWWHPYDDATFSNGSDDNGSYSILPNGTNTTTTTTTINPCPGFTSCSAQEASSTSGLNRKGTVIALGAALSSLVLLMHFALFVSACRYTNARRANSVAAAAAAVADRMYGEKKLGGDGAAGGEWRDPDPNAGFVPIGEPVEQQAPLRYGMPPASTGVTGE